MKHTLKTASVYTKGKLYLPGEEVDLPKEELVSLGEVEATVEKKPTGSPTKAPNTTPDKTE